MRVNIKQAMIELNINRSYLAKCCNVSRAYMSRVINGSTKCTKIMRLKIEMILNKERDYKIEKHNKEIKYLSSMTGWEI